MADPVKSARRYLDGLKGKGNPWDEPLSSTPAPPKAKATPAPSEKPKSTGDDASDQIGKLVKRNKEFADRTRHLRGGSRSY